MRSADEPLLGLATTRQLLEEIKARGETEPHYRDLGDSMAIGAANLIDDLPGSMLDYRTVDGHSDCPDSVGPTPEPADLDAIREHPDVVLELALKTPEEWQAELPGVVIHDPDGWRGAGGRPWTDRIGRREYLERRARCTVSGVADA
jgi:hypothetical protein